MCVCASRKSPFARRTAVVTAPGAGGVSPPWQTQRAGIGDRISAIASAHATRSGWRQPPVVRALVMRAKRNHPAIDDTRCKHGFRNHGGLTPAALVNVRLCIPKIAIRPTHGRCYSTRSGGRKPPVANAACRYRGSHICNSIRTRNQERLASAPRGAGVGHARETQSPRDRRYPLQTRFPKPRRAHARRSCFDSRDSPDTIRCALPARPNATHGGLTLAAFDSRSDFRRIMPDSRGVPSYRSRQKRPPLQAPIAPTAGLRPPLL
jgi:hypothetical protein